MVPPRAPDPVGGRPLALTRPNASHRLYRGLMRLLLLPALAWFWIRGAREPGYRARLGERLGRIERQPRSLGGILVHAASVGEVQAARPLIDTLLERWPAHAITLSTMTPTGADTARAAWGDRVRHVFLPLDTPGNVTRFLDRLRPRAVLLLEREIWPELLLQCRQREIPVALVNARLTPASSRGYRRWNHLTTALWQRLDRVVAADAASLALYRELGVPDTRLHLSGNLKFDAPQPEARPSGGIEAPPGRRIVVAGSTHAAEEAALLPRWKAHVAEHPQDLLVLVPRHPQRFDEVSRQLDSLGLAHARRSRGELPGPDTPVWLGDTMGELPQWYGIGQACFIGGTLAYFGGHNPLEAMACARPVVFGPDTRNFDELYRAIDARGAGRLATDAVDAMRQLARWLASPDEAAAAGQRALALVHENQGATERTLQALAPLWDGDRPQELMDVRVVPADRGGEVWFDASRFTDLTPNAFAAGGDAVALATGSGRGQAMQFGLQGHAVLLRHYRRGGLMARLSEDTYRGRVAAHSRAMEEFALLRLMRSWALPVPRPVAARFSPVGAGRYRADIVVEIIPGTRNLVQRLQQSALDGPSWAAVGRVVRRMHDRQVCHTDLNAHNLLLDDQGEAWIVDFDKCAVRPGEDWKSQNLDRLRRSLRKESTRCNPYFWTDADWPLLLAGYGGDRVQPRPRPA